MKFTLITTVVAAAATVTAQQPLCPPGGRFPTAYCCARNKAPNPAKPLEGFYYNCYRRSHFGCRGRVLPWDVCCYRLRQIGPNEKVTIPNVPASQKITNVAVRCTYGLKAPRMMARDVEPEPEPEAEAFPDAEGLVEMT